MSSLNKSVIRILTLAPLALIAQISTSAAANPLIDCADEQRAGISSNSETVFAAANAPHSSKAARYIGDAQRQAEEMLLGVYGGGPSASYGDSKVARSAGDAQQRAKEMLQGVHAGAPSGPRSSSKVARSTGDAQQQAKEVLQGIHDGTPSVPAAASDRTGRQERIVVRGGLPSEAQ